MRKILFPLVAACAALFAAGCAGPEQKLGRGVSNSWDIIRLGEMRRTVEQTSVLSSPGEGYTVGVIRGFDRSVARTGLGLYEMVTFPFPPYHPIATKYFTPGPAYPESYKPGLISDPLFDTDTYTGFSGGDIAPFVPGSRFKVFDN
ncbi:MAG: exosortase system-associated protein, TIGR04073 family [Verrucomicrobia bacterium]|nr:exosortase system-associated protein, TIGR04073 family [Verrucomicrobiota bacterium]